jgi:hypothetical protein
MKPFLVHGHAGNKKTYQFTPWAAWWPPGHGETSSRGMKMGRSSVGVAARILSLAGAMVSLAVAFFSSDASALPLFARQTGQNCVACHAGGQFPVLTAYGRLFKLTGFTTGERNAVPLAMMVMAGSTRVANTTNGSMFDPLGGSGLPSDNYPKNGLGDLAVSQVSLFAGGKITDNIGLFGQWTMNPYASQDGNSHWQSHTTSDQFDLRYADRFVDANRDLIFGVSLNNNVGTTDVWNTFNNPFQIVPSPIGPAGLQGNAFIGPQATPYINGGNLEAGVNAYVYWNQTLYAELGFYKSPNGAFSFLSKGYDDGSTNKLQGNNNPYWRIALTHDWGPNSAMIGLHGITVKTYYDNTDDTSPIIKNQDYGIDGEYQYNLDPHSFTGVFSYTKEKQSYDDALWDPANPNPLGYAANPSNTINLLKLSGIYVYQAKYGASLSYLAATGSTDTTLYAPNAITGSANGSPNTRVWVPEVFWTPIQYLRVGLQFYRYKEFNGSSGAYDGVSSRTASDNNMTFLYLWAAY